MAKNYQSDRRAALASEAWRLRVERGWSQARIASHLGCNQGTVSRWLNAARAKAVHRLRDDAILHLADQFERLDAMIELAWDGWLRSREDAVTVKVAEAADGSVTTTTTRGQSGDPRFLAEIRSLLQQQREILGLTLKYDGAEEGGGEQIGPEDLRREIERIRIAQAQSGESCARGWAKLHPAT